MHTPTGQGGYLQLRKKPTHTYFLSFVSNPSTANVVVDWNGSFINNLPPQTNKKTTTTKSTKEKEEKEN